MPQLSNCFQFNGTSLSQIAESNINETVELINQAYSYQNQAKGEPRISAEKLRQRIASSEFYIVKLEDQVVGCVYTQQVQRRLHFGLLTVIDSQRGSGLGAALMRAVELYARRLGCEAIELDYMSLAPWLKSYYEKHGYAETGEITPWGNVDLIRMTKLL